MTGLSLGVHIRPQLSCPGYGFGDRGRMQEEQAQWFTEDVRLNYY